MKVFVMPYDENHIDEYLGYYKEYKNYFKNDDIKLALAFDRVDLAEHSFKTIVEQVRGTIGHGIGPKHVVITFYNNFAKKVFSKEEIERLKMLRAAYKNVGIDVRVYDYKDAYTIEEVESASKKIVEYANDINKRKFSPLEKLLHAYLIVSDRNYIAEKEEDSPSKSRSVFSILNNKEIVCTGYSTYLKTLVEELKDPNIKIFCNMVAARTAYKDSMVKQESIEDSYGFHQNNIAYVKDEKYGIDGFFYLDPTWDCDEIKDLGQIRLNFFMIPLSEIKTINYYNISDYLTASEECIKKMQEEGEMNLFDHKKIVPREKEEGGEEHDTSRVRDRIASPSNLPYPLYSSLAKSTFRMEILKKYSDFSEDSLYQFLSSREDFQNFSVDNYLKLKKIDKRYKAANAKKAMSYIKKYPKQFYGKITLRKMYNFMQKNTHYVDMSFVLTSLKEVIKSNFPELDKDTLSKVIHVIAKNNIAEAKLMFNNKSETPFGMLNYKIDNYIENPVESNPLKPINEEPTNNEPTNNEPTNE